MRFNEFFATLKRVGFDGPLQVHYEYALGGAEGGGRQITMPKEQVIAAMKRDVEKLRDLWKA